MEVFNINHSVSGCRVSSKLAFFSRLIMLYRFLKWRPLRRNFTFGFGLADSLQKIRVYQQTKFRSYSSIYVWVITTSDLEKNKHPPYWNPTSSFDFDHITVLGMSRWIRLQNFVQIGPSSAEIRCYVDFQDGGRCGAILLPVSNRLISLFLKVSFCHQTKFRSCNSIHGWNITISVLKKTNVRRTGILLPFSISITSPYSTCYSASGIHVSSKSDNLQRRYVITILKLAAAAVQFYFRFRIGWRRCLQNVRVYQQTDLHSYNSILSWDITISVLEKQTSAILEFYSRFRFRPCHRSRHVILYQPTMYTKQWRI